MGHALFISSNVMKKIIFALLSVCCIAAHAQYSNVSSGDIIDINGVKAIVFNVDDSGEHGTAMTINCLRGVKEFWCTDNKLSKIDINHYSSHEYINGIIQAFIL